MTSPGQGLIVVFGGVFLYNKTGLKNTPIIEERGKTRC